MIIKFIRWVFEKFAAAALIVALGLAAGGLWLFLKDRTDFDQWRQDVVRSINGDRTKVQSALGDVHQRMDRLSLEIAAEQERAKQADKVIAQLKELESAWDRVVGNPAQQKSNAEQLTKMNALRATLTAKVQALTQDFTRTTWERDGLEIAVGKLDARLRAAEAQRSKVLHYLERVWEHQLGRGRFHLPVKWWVYAFLALYFVGPTAGKVGMYFVVAPLIAGGRPVRLAAAAGGLPEMGASGVSTVISLRGGERLWVKEKFLQASDEGLKKQTRYLLDWRIPFTCLATGLIELIEMQAAADEGERRVTLSNQNDPHSELAVITLAEGVALVLRPSFLAGAVVAADAKLHLRRRWQFFRWQAWVTLQFRFFEFAGPCRLVVAGNRGVRMERLDEREGGAVPARRTNQDATMGFTPQLDYRPVRAETFWSYYRGMNPLFDDLFAGRGLFLCQQVSASGDTAKARKFWSGIWSGAMRVFGI
ncbi:MAG: hypothetical protein EXS32_09690 [Opitutus sp.]|nr:hypothetical protein [Opitutus sp.]